MNMRFLGKTGIKVSELSFGTMTFGVASVGQKEADVMVKMALEAGINCFDSADVYSGGLSEEMLGRALGNRRKDVVIATKVRMRTGPGPNEVRLSRHHIIEGCNASLKRLGTDYIDLYQVHDFDKNTALEETLWALDNLVRQGKIRYTGCCNFAAWRLMKSLAISEKHGWDKFVSFQGFYSLGGRDIEYELVPLCLDQGLGILVWGPLSGGFFSGKYHQNKPRPKDCRLSEPNNFSLHDEDKCFKMIPELEGIAKEHDATVAQTALNYLLRKPGVTSVIVGAKTKEQLADNLKAAEWEMTKEETGRLDKVSEPAPIYPHKMFMPPENE